MKTRDEGLEQCLEATQFELPADVEVFLNECAAAIPDTTDYPERLIALARAQGVRIADLEATIKQMEDDDHDRRMEALEYD